MTVSLYIEWKDEKHIVRKHYFKFYYNEIWVVWHKNVVKFLLLDILGLIDISFIRCFLFLDLGKLFQFTKFTLDETHDQKYRTPQ